MIRCKKCVMVITRPDSHFLDGVCSGCRSYDERKNIDWDARWQALKVLIAEAKSRGAPWDLVIPTSGGKDSTVQVLKARELGAKVLAVNSATDMLSEIGRRNLDNLKRFCDVMEVTPNIEVRKKLVRLGLHHIGDLSFPEHCAIWAIPTRVAAAFGIPLVLWGEQPQREYSAPEGIEPATELNSAWVAQFGGLGGLRLSDLVGQEGLTEEDLRVFQFPSDAVLNKAGVKGVWLGDYMDWDGWKNSFIAKQYGFETLPHVVEQSLADYENLDNLVTVPRDWLRFCKFGYARATDIACNHIRRGRLTRDEGLTLIAKAERFPWTSLGKPLEMVLAYFGITISKFIDECDRWTNFELFDHIRYAFDPAETKKPAKHSDGTPKFRKPNGAGETHHTGAAL